MEFTNGLSDNETVFREIKKDSVIYEPIDLYCLSFGFEMPIERSAYKESKSEALHLDEIEADRQSITYELDNCIYGELLIDDLSKSLDLEGKHGMKPSDFELDADYYTLEWSLTRPDSKNSHFTRSFVQCEHSFDLEGLSSDELKKYPVKFFISIAQQDKESCYEEIADLYKKVQQYAKDTLINPKDLEFNKDVDKMLEKAKREISLEKSNDNNVVKEPKEIKHSLKPKQNSNVVNNSLEKE